MNDSCRSNQHSASTTPRGVTNLYQKVSITNKRTISHALLIFLGLLVTQRPTSSGTDFEEKADSPLSLHDTSPIDISHLDGIAFGTFSHSAPASSNQLHNHLRLDLSSVGDDAVFTFDQSTLQSPGSQPASSLANIDLNTLDMLPTMDHNWHSGTDKSMETDVGGKTLLNTLDQEQQMGTFQHYQHESSSIASIVSSLIRESLAAKYQPTVGASLQQICSQSLDATQSPWMCDLDIGSIVQGRPAYDEATVMIYTEAYFEHFVRRFPYITREQASFYVHAFLGDNFKDDSVAVGLVNTVLAQGCRLVLSAQTRDYDHATTEAKKYFAAALNAKSRLVGVRPSVLTIQTLVAMTIHARDLQNLSIASSLVSLAAQHCLALKLNRTKNLQAAARDQQELELMQRLFWVVYSLEKPLAMRLGRSSVINDETIDYSPRVLSNHSSKGDYSTFLHYCEWAQMCSQVVSKLYGATSFSAQGNDAKNTTSSLTDRLEAWRTSTTQSSRSRRESSCSVDVMVDQVDSLLRYHELVVTLLHR
jgi:hypothetical protein